MREVSYARQTLDSPNPVTRFAHRARYAASLDLADRLLVAGGTLLDFGAGEGTFLAMLGAKRPDASLIAVEPHMAIAHRSIRRIDTLADVPPASIDVIGAFEVLEHVSDGELHDFLGAARAALRPGGSLLITVPIMYGAALPVKELSRFLLHRRWGDIGARDLARATIGRPIARSHDRLSTHTGFDFRRLRAEVGETFMLRTETFSPFARLPWWLNSQAILVARTPG